MNIGIPASINGFARSTCSLPISVAITESARPVFISSIARYPWSVPISQTLAPKGTRESDLYYNLNQYIPPGAAGAAGLAAVVAACAGAVGCVGTVGAANF